MRTEKIYNEFRIEKKKNAITDLYLSEYTGRHVYKPWQTAKKIRVEIANAARTKFQDDFADYRDFTWSQYSGGLKSKTGKNGKIIPPTLETLTAYQIVYIVKTLRDWRRSARRNGRAIRTEKKQFFTMIKPNSCQPLRYLKIQSILPQNIQVTRP